MQAITTKYLPPTNTLPRRVKAECQAGSVTISDDGMSTHDRDLHNAAARKLCEKLDWHGYLVEGTTKQGDNVYVFVPHIAGNIRKGDLLRVGNPTERN